MSKREDLLKLYPPGSVLELLEKIKDPYTPKYSGEIFTVRGIDDLGQIHGLWESGGSIAIIPEEDKFRRIK